VPERISLRGIERLFAISRRTAGDWIEQWAEQLPLLEATLADARMPPCTEQKRRCLNAVP
jgi:hypothetical protein